MEIGKPASTEYAPYYARYVAQVPAGPLLTILAEEVERTRELLLGPVAQERAGFRYSPGKWSVREVVGHMADTERVMAYRALRFARADRTELSGFDETSYTPMGEFEARSLVDLVDDFTAVRHASLALFRGLPAAAWARSGSASGAKVTVRGLGYIIAGHELHHRGLLLERYFA